jgi:hypothetical protein
MTRPAFTHMPVPYNERNRTRRSTRGSVVLLALAAVATATFLGLTLASTRDANLAASTNLAKAAKARAAAAGALEFAADLLRDPEILGNNNGSSAIGEDGTLFEELSVGEAVVRARVHDLGTHEPAHSASEAVEITVEGTCNGVSQTTRAVGRITPPAQSSEADIDCSEFALLATESLAIERDVLLTRWPSAPLSALGEPVAYGLASGETSGLSVSSEANIFGCARIQRGDFALSSEASDDDLSQGTLRIPAEIHVVLAPLPPALRDDHEDAEQTHDGVVLRIDGLVDGAQARSRDTREDTEAPLGGGACQTSPVGRVVAHSDVVVPTRAAAVLRNALVLDVAGNFTMERGARLRVEGNTSLIVRGNVLFETASLEVVPGAKLTIVAAGDVSIDASYIGGERTDTLEQRDASGLARYDGGAARTAIFVAGDHRVVISEGSVVKGEVHAPEARVLLDSRSAIYGRVLGGEVRLRAGTAVFFDPALDAQRGWTKPNSGVWTALGEVRPAVRNIERLDAASLARFAEETSIAPVATVLPAEPLNEEDSRARGLLHAAEMRTKAAQAARRAWRTTEEREVREPVQRFASLGFDAPLAVQDE